MLTLKEVKTKTVNIEKVRDKSKEPPIYDGAIVKYTKMGNVSEIQYMTHKSPGATIKPISADQYIVLRTGEIKDVVHKENRSQNIKALQKTFKNLRAVINTNITDVSKVRWCTLTYAENMTDTEKLYKDFETFHKRFKRYCTKHGWSIPEYIVMMEPQGRGAWHAHLLYIWTDQKAPYIPNQDFAEIWGHGFVSVKKLDDVDNVGAYLTAYLGDMELSEAEKMNLYYSDHDVKNVEVEDDQGRKQTKSYVKGARLYMYPTGFHMMRTSRGIKRPEPEQLRYSEAKEKVKAATLTYHTCSHLTDEESDFESYIIKDYYNTKRTK